MSKRILVVEPDPLIGDRLKRLMEEQGLEVQVLGDARTIQSGFEEFQPDLVIVEPRLPGARPEEVLQQVTEICRGRRVPLVVLTEDFDPENKLKALRLGATDYITKPYVREELQLKIKNLLEVAGSADADRGANADRAERLLALLRSGEVAELVPEVDAGSRYGYSVSRAAEVLGVRFAGEELDLLDDLASEGRLEREFFDVVHLCPACAHYNLNFREVCPTCESANIRVQKLYEHTSCGARAARSEFLSQEGKCPRCRKPVQVEALVPDGFRFFCRQCHNVFYEPVVMCRCLQCGRLYDVDKLEKRVIWKYTVPPGDGVPHDATKVKLRGRSELEPFLNERLRGKLLSKDELLTMLEDELEAHRRVSRPFTLAQVRFEGLHRLRREIGEAKVARLVAGLLDRFLDRLPTGTIAGLYPGPVVVLMLKDTPIHEARRVISKLLRELSATVGEAPLAVRLAGFPQDGHEVSQLLELLDAGIDSLTLAGEALA